MGFNVSCQEVERVLAEHAAVFQAALVPIPDERATEVGAAFIRLREGATCAETELIDFCRARLADYKVPRYVRFLDAFSESTGGKVQQFVLRDRLLQEIGAKA